MFRKDIYKEIRGRSEDRTGRKGDRPMVINFEERVRRKKEKSAYRQELVEKIAEWHRVNRTQMSRSRFYMEYLRDGFPLYVLERMVEEISA